MIRDNCSVSTPHTSHVWDRVWKYPDAPDTKEFCLCPGREAPDPDPKLGAAIATYEFHSWDATSRLCACGETFEASLTGHQLHRQHRMRETLQAADLTSGQSV